MSNSSSDFSEGELVLLFTCRVCGYRVTEAEKIMHRATHTNSNRAWSLAYPNAYSYPYGYPYPNPGAQAQVETAAQDVTDTDSDKEEVVIMFICRRCGKEFTDAEKDAHRAANCNKKQNSAPTAGGRIKKPAKN